MPGAISICPPGVKLGLDIIWVDAYIVYMMSCNYMEQVCSLGSRIKAACILACLPQPVKLGLSSRWSARLLDSWPLAPPQVNRVVTMGLSNQFGKGGVTLGCVCLAAWPIYDSSRRI